jgi:hypothetical protein
MVMISEFNPKTELHVTAAETAEKVLYLGSDEVHPFGKCSATIKPFTIQWPS